MISFRYLAHSQNTILGQITETNKQKKDFGNRGVKKQQTDLEAQNSHFKKKT